MFIPLSPEARKLLRVAFRTLFCSSAALICGSVTLITAFAPPGLA